VPDDDGVGPAPDLFDYQSEHALTVGDLEGLGGILELGEKPLQALGERHVRLGIEAFRSRVASWAWRVVSRWRRDGIRVRSSSSEISCSW
jgi:hypothetical protein